MRTCVGTSGHIEDVPTCILNCVYYEWMLHVILMSESVSIQSGSEVDLPNLFCL